MTVAELIEKLRAMPPEMEVLTPGFDEGGYRSPSVEQVTVYWAPRCPEKGFPGQFQNESGSHIDFAEGDDDPGTPEPEPIPREVALINFDES